MIKMFNKKNARALEQIRRSVIFTLAIMIVATFTTVQVLAVDSAFESVDVDTAYDMTTSDNPDQVILDVRPQDDYRLTHLYDATSVPFDELEMRIGELQGHEDHEIIVYCMSGVTSLMASEFLVEHGFKRVYNMLGGISKWVEADYPVYTTSHYVTTRNGVLRQIEPMLLHQSGCSFCDGNQTCPSGSETGEIEFTILEQDEDHKITLLTYEFNNSVFDYVIAVTYLWNYTEVTDRANRTASFISTEITGQDSSSQFYSLRYVVQHADYNLVLDTILSPLDSDTYNISLTVVRYVPVGEAEAVSLEFIEFETSSTLSKLYENLGLVAKNIGDVYDTSDDENLKWLARNYYRMDDEITDLSKFVRIQLRDYNWRILRSNAVLIDDWYSCWTCMILLEGLCIVGCSALAAKIPVLAIYWSECVSLGCVAFSNWACWVLVWWGWEVPPCP